MAERTTLYAMPDGGITLRPIAGTPIVEDEPWMYDWRIAVIDLLKQGDISRAVIALLEHEGDPLGVEPERDVYTLPVFECDTEAHAHALRVRHCRLMIEEHPLMPGERWYRWNAGSLRVADLPSVAAVMRKSYRAILRRR